MALHHACRRATLCIVANLSPRRGISVRDTRLVMIIALHRPRPPAHPASLLHANRLSATRAANRTHLNVRAGPQPSCAHNLWWVYGTCTCTLPLQDIPPLPAVTTYPGRTFTEWVHHRSLKETVVVRTESFRAPSVSHGRPTPFRRFVCF